MSTNQNQTGIAIIGMAGRFPKARNVDAFWRNLCAGGEAISFFTDEELEAAGVDFPKGDPNYVKARGVLEDADLFDASFFGVTPREAEVMDPQHRVFLECAWEALEHAGCDPATFDGAIGVFAGMSMNTYLAQNVLTRPELVSQLNEHQLMLGNDKDFLPTRVSYKLNLRGPSLNIQTACSTSLVAVCVACQNLLNYECDAALAGAVSLVFPQKRGYRFQQGGIASPDGHCRAFDAAASGAVAGEGAGIVVLKRLEDALASGDVIYAVIKGFALNNDGSNKVGYTAPSVEGQAQVITTAQAMAGFLPETIGYVEAHGTGTPLGDPIEIEGLTQAFRAGTSKTQFCAIGSVKASIGHLDVAAGVAGLIKTALVLHHGQIPPSLHFRLPNPAIDFVHSPFFVNEKLTDWKKNSTPRRAGVSSFGMGGTNAHVVLEEAPLAESADRPRSAQLLLLSAKTQTALDRATVNLATHLQQHQHPDLELADVAFTLQTGRQAFAHRRMLLCHDAADAASILGSRDPKRVLTRTAERGNPPVVFMFPGQGAQQVGMGRKLYEQEPAFREQVDLCCEFLQAHLGLDLRTVLYPEPERSEAAQTQLTQTALTQPALFVIEYALAQLWLSWGVRPEAMLGHSLGEYVAACLAGVFSLEDALALVAARGRMMQQLPGGRMLAVRLSESAVKPLLDEAISLAAVNAPSLSVLSGPAGPMERVQCTLAERSVACTPLATSHAFHSVMMDPILQSFAERVGQVKANPPRLPFISNVTGAWITAQQATDPMYWAKHLRQTVRFADGVGELFADSKRVFLETGPGRTLAQLTRQHPARPADGLIVPSLGDARDSASEAENLMHALGHLWLAGAEIDWRQVYRHQRRRRVPLPTYPFERNRYFIEPAGATRAPTASLHAQAAPPEEEKQVVLPIHHLSGGAPATPKAGIAATLRSLLCELAGLNPAVVDETTTFVEMGLESLFLTQFAAAIESKLGVRVAFRQLLENLSTLQALAAHIERSGSRDGEAHGSRTKPETGSTPETPASALPLTEAQREIWLASQMSDAASCAYNECRLLHLRGDLKANTLAAAIQRLVDRHEALRTTFTNGGQFQRIQPALELEVPVLDWSSLGAETRASRLEALQHEEARLPFDLAAGPLLRAWLLRLEESHYVLVLTVHHIVCDGHSLGVLLAELAAIYSAECRGVPVELPLPLQWRQYVQSQTLQQAAGAPDDSYWLEQFARGAPVLDLPTDAARPSTWTFEGAHASHSLPAPLVAALKRLSARRHGTLFTTLLAAYGTLLHRLSGQDEIVIGLPVADRSMEGGPSLVGHCVNFLPLRLNFDPDETFEAHLARVQRHFLEAYEHRHCTFGRLLQKLELARDTNRMPLVSVTFNVERLGAGLAFPGLETELHAAPESFTNFDLGFNVTEIGDSLQVDCRYNRGLFTAHTLRRWLGHFQTLLEAIVAKPSQKICALPLLSEAEQRRLLVEWSHGGSKPAKYPNEKCLHQLFEQQAARTPDAIAVVFEGKATTYGQLNRLADLLAQHLRSLGAGPDVPVGLCLERSMELVAGILGILKAGAAYVPLDPAYPGERITFMLQDTRMPILLTQSALRDQLKLDTANLKCVCVDELPQPQPEPQRGSRTKHEGGSSSSTGARTPSANNLAYVIYTSGSTGTPKGVMVSHQNVTRLFAATQPWYQFNERDVWTLFHSPAFDFSVWEIWGALLYGGRLVVVPYLTSRSPKAFLELLARERVTVLNQTPSAFRQLSRAEQDSPQPIRLALRHLIFGGEALEMHWLKPWFERHGDQVPCLVNMYGITETTVHVTYRPLTAHDLNSGSVIGVAIPDLEIYILDARRQPVPVGVPGELYVGGAGVARGYLNRPELTAERFVPDPFRAVPGARLYKTGDLARWLANGDIEYLGRADSQVKIRGHRIELGEIEAALAAHPGVRESVVVARDEPTAGKQLVAYVVANPAPPAPHAAPDASDLRRWLQEKLPDYMLPAAFVFLDKLPLTANGKIDRRALPAPEAVPSESNRTFVPPATPTEEALAEIWCEVLHLERVGIHDNFFELGGHSLLMTQVLSRARAAFQVDLPVRRFFESPTIAALAAALEQMIFEEMSDLDDGQVPRLVSTTA